MNEYIGRTTPGASIAIVSGDEIVYAKGFGYTSTAKDTPVDASATVFEWGSISKLFVWVSVLQLVEQGRLDLNAPISDYLSDAEMPKLRYKGPITMLHLMNHSAGFEEYILHLLSDSKEDVLPLSEFLKRYQPYQAYPPGEMVAYSNYGTSLAASIVEKITNQSYEDYVKKHILIPLGMNDTIVTIANDADLARIADRRATGYVSLRDGEFVEASYSYLSLYPSGSLNGPATDLAKFAIALLARAEEDNVLFDQLDTLKLLFTTTYAPGGLTPGIAHGFWEYQGAHTSYSHGGNTKGFAANFHVVPDAGFGVVILTNQVAEVAISYGLMDALLTDPNTPYEALPLNEQIDYRGQFISARNTNHTFTKLYYHLIPLTIEPDYENNVLTVSYAGVSGRYQQIGSGDFRLVSGDPLFFTMKNIHLETDGARITSIYAPTTSFYPMEISATAVLITIGLVLLLFVYMVVICVVYLIRGRRSTQPLRNYALAMLLQVLLLINTGLLAVRVLNDPYRTLEELMIQIVISCGLGILTIIALLYMLIRAIRSKAWMKVHFLSTLVVVILFQAFFLYWRFYSF
jgi:CubicO group peptidase (beta-lactamase class C family)